jgi:hypothetical protein
VHHVAAPERRGLDAVTDLDGDVQDSPVPIEYAGRAPTRNFLQDRACSGYPAPKS